MKSHVGMGALWLVLMVLASCVTDTGHDTGAAVVASPALPGELQAVAWQARQRQGGADYLLVPGTSDTLVATGRCSAQQMSFRFSDRAVDVRLAAGVRLGIELAGLGRGDALHAPEAGESRVTGRAIHYTRGALTEWYLNGPVGLEQGFVVHTRPGGVGPLGIAVAIDGLTPELRGDRVALLDERGRTRAWYGALHVVDAAAAIVPSWLEVSGRTIVLRIDDAEASYPLDVDPFVWTEHKTLAVGDDAGDELGTSVAVSGDTAIVGARYDDEGGSNAGAAYIFERDEGGADNWGLVKKLIASNPDPDDNFGWSVAIDGDTAVVGAWQEDSAGGNAGGAYVFERNFGGANAWGERKRLAPIGSVSDARFGYSVDISGDSMVIGARLDERLHANGGAAYVFDRNLGGVDNWGQRAVLTASDTTPGAEFGVSVGIDVDTIVVGAFGEDSIGQNGGKAYVFSRNQDGPNAWGEVMDLTPMGHIAGDFFGVAVAVSGDAVLVGSHWQDTNGDVAGAAYIFSRDQGGANNWGEVRRLLASDGQAGDHFGVGVALEGDTALVAAGDEDSGGVDAGAIYVFSRDEGGAGNWGETQKIVVNDAQAGDKLGSHYDGGVELSGGTAVFGAPFKGSGDSKTGTAYLFELRSDVCTSDADCGAGFCVDEVCCDTACGGGVDDCQACNVPGSEGTCRVFSLATVCRPSAGACDVEETCDGTNGACPADAVVAAETVCRAAVTDCDSAESCDGATAACPADELAPEGTGCDDGVGMCALGSCVPGDEPAEPPVDGGCGCRVGGRGSPTPALFILVGLGLAMLRRLRSSSGRAGRRR